MRYLKDLLSKNLDGKNKQAVKKLMQGLLGTKGIQVDTDPVKNPYFSVLCDLLFPDPKEQVIVIHSSQEGEFFTTTPKKLPVNLSIDTTEKEAASRFLVLVQLPSGLFSPYGKTYQTQRTDPLN
jgi:hypothetical protein